MKEELKDNLLASKSLFENGIAQKLAEISKGNRFNLFEKTFEEKTNKLKRFSQEITVFASSLRARICSRTKRKSL